MEYINLSLENEKTYDAVFWTGVVRLQRFLIPLINEAFHENLPADAEIRLKPTKHTHINSEGAFNTEEMDSLVEISTHESTVEQSRLYHFECETWADGSMGIRIAEYASGYAFDSIRATESGAEMVLPNSAVIFLRKAERIGDTITITVKYPGGQISYPVPVIKIKSYDIEELFNKRLYLLLPFFGFHFEDDFDAMEQDEEKIDKLKARMDDINDRLTKAVDEHDLHETEKQYLIDLMKRVFEKLTIKYGNVRKGVEEIMGGYILKTRTDDIINQGIEKGIEKGIEEGTAVGENRMSKLIQMLLSDGRNDEISKVVSDATERDKMYKFYGIII